MSEITDQQVQIVEELVNFMEKYNIKFSADDPYCGVEVDFLEYQPGHFVVSARLKHLKEFISLHRGLAQK